MFQYFLEMNDDSFGLEISTNQKPEPSQTLVKLPSQCEIHIMIPVVLTSHKGTPCSWAHLLVSLLFNTSLLIQHCWEFLHCPSSSVGLPLWQARARSSCADGGGRCPEEEAAIESSASHPSYCPAMHWQRTTDNAHWARLIICLSGHGSKVAVAAYAKLLICPAMHW